jgi:hypothetical protein
MRTEFIGYLAIALIFSIFFVLLIYFGLQTYDERDPIARTFAKNMITLGFAGIIFIIIAFIVKLSG